MTEPLNSKTLSNRHTPAGTCKFYDKQTFWKIERMSCERGKKTYEQ